MRRPVMLQLQELPHRATALSVEQISAVFGGCHTPDHQCSPDKNDCCPGWDCEYIGANGLYYEHRCG